MQVVNGAKHPGAVGPPPSKITPPEPAIPAELKGQPLKGWRDIYVERGPDAWAKAVRAHPGVLLTDTTM
jgi:pyruvate carboxylase